MGYELRPYQQKCVDFTIERFKTSQKPMLIVAPTGSGKSHIIAGLSNIWDGKVLVLTLSKELCEQDSAKMEIVMGKENAGMYSASWGRKEVKQVTVATIQSAYKHPELWEDFDLIIADECLDGDCQVLTKDGWVSLKDFTGDKEIAQFHPEDSSIDFALPERIVKKEADEVYRFYNSRGLDFYATKNHRHLIWNRKWKEKVLKTDDNYRLVERRRSFVLETVTSEEMCKLCGNDNGWIVDNGIVRQTSSTPMEKVGIMLEADGCNIWQDKNGNITWRVQVSKTRKIEKAREILTEAGIDFKEAKRPRPSFAKKGWLQPTSFYFKLDDTDYKCFKNFLALDNIPVDFIEQAVFWDGNVNKEGVYSWNTSKAEEADFVATAAAISGVGAPGVTIWKHKNPKGKDGIKLTFRKMTGVRKVNAQCMGSTKCELVKEKRMMYCVTVPTSYFMVKKGDAIWVTGNCEVMPVGGMLGKLVDGKKVIGLTATPYGTVGSRQGKWFTTKIWPMHKIKTELGWFWQPVEYCITEQELLDAGYLCPLKIYSTPIDCWKLKLNSNGSEFTQKSIGEWISQIYDRIIQVMTGAEEHGMCHSGIVFMPSVESCEELVKICQQKGISAAAIHSKTPPKERDAVVDAHKAGELTWLINQNVATRGFDNPKVDCLILARPTNSLRLHRQMLGRCCRIADGKECGYVLDLTNNCKKFGNLTDVQMGKNGWADTILLRGKDISGTEVSRLNLDEARKRAIKKRKEENEGN